jgi:hypothetical protein
VTDTVPAGYIAGIQTLLSTIRISAGYRTNIAHVYRGQDALTVSLADFPAITIHSRAETPMGCTDTGSVEQDYRRTLVIEGILSDQGDWDAGLDGLLDDIRRCLLVYRDTSLTYTGVEFLPPTPQSQFALVKITLNLSYELLFEDIP